MHSKIELLMKIINIVEITIKYLDREIKVKLYSALIIINLSYEIYANAFFLIKITRDILLRSHLMLF